MSGCKSCSGCRPEPSFKSIEKLEKLSKQELSGNPRYPHIVPGCQAMLTDETRQVIVEVLSDECDETTDRFTLRVERVLRNLEGPETSATISVKQAVGKGSWKLQALI